MKAEDLAELKRLALLIAEPPEPYHTHVGGVPLESLRVESKLFGQKILHLLGDHRYCSKAIWPCSHSQYEEQLGDFKAGTKPPIHARVKEQSDIALCQSVSPGRVEHEARFGQRIKVCGNCGSRDLKKLDVGPSEPGYQCGNCGVKLFG